MSDKLRRKMLPYAEGQAAHESRTGCGRRATLAPATDEVNTTRLTVSFAFTTEPSTFCTAETAQPASSDRLESLDAHDKYDCMPAEAVCTNQMINHQSSV